MGELVECLDCGARMVGMEDEGVEDGGDWEWRAWRMEGIEDGGDWGWRGWRMEGTHAGPSQPYIHPAWCMGYQKYPLHLGFPGLTCNECSISSPIYL